MIVGELGREVHAAETTAEAISLCEDRALQVRLFAKGGAMLADMFATHGLPTDERDELPMLALAAILDRAARDAGDLAEGIECIGHVIARQRS